MSPCDKMKRKIIEMNKNDNLGIEVVVGAGFGVVVGFVHDFDKYFRIGVLGTK